ncbi:MAG: HEAT repeat domain-containing protein [Gemmatimonadaceae bacterium]
MMPSILSSVFALPTSNLSMLMTLAKATIILVAAIAITVTMRRASAGSRHLVWLVTLGTLLLVPALTAWGPLRLAILPPTRVAAPRIHRGVANPSTGTPSAATIDARVNAAVQNVISSKPITTVFPSRGLLARLKGLRGFPAMIAIWAAIVVLIAGWLMYGALVVRGIVRRARPLDTQDWLVPLYEVSDRLELDEAPRLLRSEDAKMPFACGVFQPTIVLPAECDNWTADRRLAVLLHELAHVRRHDLAGHTLGRVACAIYWFHPLVWTAAKQLRSESERACDDLALSCGARASDYAEHLLDIVTSVRHDRTPAVALAMARRKEFEGRMLAILDPELRHSSPSRWQSAALIASLAVVAVVVGAAAPAPRAEVLATIGTMPPAHAKDKAHSAIEKGAAPTWRKNEDIAPPAQKPTPAYPNSGVRGVASIAQQMIERFSQNTQIQTTMQTHTEMQGPVPSEKTIDKQVDKKVEQSLRRQERSREQGTGRADDRPQLLATVLKTDTSASLRRIAAWGLSEYAETSVATEALATALRKDPNSSVREMAAWALSQADNGSPTAIDALIAALRGDSDPKVRTTALWALGEIGDERSIDAVMASLSDPSAGIRERAVWAIGQMSPRQAPPALIALLRDSDPRVREITAWALYEIEDPAAVPALNAALHAETDKSLQIAYIRALAATGEKSVDAIRGLLDSKDPAIRSMAVRALAGGNGNGPWPWPWPEPRPYP